VKQARCSRDTKKNLHGNLKEIEKLSDLSVERCGQW